MTDSMLVQRGISPDSSGESLDAGNFNAALQSSGYDVLKQRYGALHVSEEVVGKILVKYKMASTSDETEDTHFTGFTLESVIDRAKDFGVSARQAATIIDDILKSEPSIDDSSVFDAAYTSLEQKLMASFKILEQMPGHTSTHAEVIDGEKMIYTFRVDDKRNVSITIEDGDPQVRGKFGPITLLYGKPSVDIDYKRFFSLQSHYLDRGAFLIPVIGTVGGIVGSIADKDYKVFHDAVVLPLKWLFSPVLFPIMKLYELIENSDAKKQLLVRDSYHSGGKESNVPLRSFLQTQASESVDSRDRVISEQFALNYLPAVVASIKTDHSEFLSGYITNPSKSL